MLFIFAHLDIFWITMLCVAHKDTGANVAMPLGSVGGSVANSSTRPAKQHKEEYLKYLKLFK